MYWWLRFEDRGMQEASHVITPYSLSGQPLSSRFLATTTNHIESQKLINSSNNNIKRAADLLTTTRSSCYPSSRFDCICTCTCVNSRTLTNSPAQVRLTANQRPFSHPPFFRRLSLLYFLQLLDSFPWRLGRLNWIDRTFFPRGDFQF